MKRNLAEVNRSLQYSTVRRIIHYCSSLCAFRVQRLCLFSRIVRTLVLRRKFCSVLHTILYVKVSSRSHYYGSSRLDTVGTTDFSLTRVQGRAAGALQPGMNWQIGLNWQRGPFPGASGKLQTETINTNTNQHY